MRKILFSLALFAFTLPLAARAGVPEAVTYLKTQTQDDWVTQALAAAGESVDASSLQSFSGASATDYAKRILAIIAAGQNPHTFTGADLVAGLKGLASVGQLGDPTLVNDDAWGIIALRAAGVSATDSAVAGAKDFLLANQNPDGGWAWGVGFGSDTNDTAAVLMALSELGHTASDAPIASAIAYLATQQGADNGYAYQLPCFWPGCEASDAASTSWVASALSKFGISSPEALAFLSTLQTGDGSFKWQAADPAGSAGMTAYAVVALSEKSYPVKRFVGGGTGRALTPIADLALSVSSPVAGDGGAFSYTYTLANLGPNVATEISVVDVVPTGFVLASAQASDGTHKADSDIWELPRLDNYASATLTIGVVPVASTAPGTITREVRVHSRELDFDQSNNIVTLTLVVPIPTPEPVVEPAPQVLGEQTVLCSELPAPVPTGTFGGFAVSPAAPSLAWYWDAATGVSYCLSDDASVRALFEKLALGITNANLALITPGSALAVRLKGRLVLQTESLGEVWYVDAAGQATYLPPTAEAIAIIGAVMK